MGRRTELNQKFAIAFALIWWQSQNARYIVILRGLLLLNAIHSKIIYIQQDTPQQQNKIPS